MLLTDTLNDYNVSLFGFSQTQILRHIQIYEAWDSLLLYSGHKPGIENMLYKMTVLATKPAFRTGKEMDINRQENTRKCFWLRRTGNIGNPSQPSPQLSRRLS